MGREKLTREAEEDSHVGAGIRTRWGRLLAAINPHLLADAGQRGRMLRPAEIQRQHILTHPHIQYLISTRRPLSADWRIASQMTAFL